MNLVLHVDNFYNRPCVHSRGLVEFETFVFEELSFEVMLDVNQHTFTPEIPSHSF